VIDRLVVASKNPDKIAEIESVLAEEGVVGRIVWGLDWPDVDETEDTLEGNALLKARTVASATGLASMADDTGLEVAALRGAPGVRTGRYAGPQATYADNVARLLDEMTGVDDRSAVFRTVVALVSPGGTPRVVEGRLDGTITHRPRGDTGFGYDPVFEVGGRTLAEMGPREKQRISHRAQAIRALAAALR